MDGQRFPTEPWMASRKIPLNPVWRVRSDRGKPLSLLTFFAAAKKVSRRKAKALTQQTK